MCLMHNGAKQTINVCALYYFGMGWPLNLEMGPILGENLDWGAVVLNEFWEHNNKLGYYNQSRVLVAEVFMDKLEDDQILFSKLNKILAGALIKAIQLHPTFEVLAKGVKPIDRAQATWTGL